MESTEIKGALAVVVRMSGEALAFRETNGKSETARDQRYAEDEAVIAGLVKLLQAASAAIQYHEAAPCINELQAAYEAMTGERVFAYRDEMDQAAFDAAFPSAAVEAV